MRAAETIDLTARSAACSIHSQTTKHVNVGPRLAMIFAGIQSVLILPPYVAIVFLRLLMMLTLQFEDFRIAFNIARLSSVNNNFDFVFTSKILSSKDG